MHTKFITSCTIAAFSLMACKNKESKENVSPAKNTISNSLVLISDVSKDLFKDLDAAEQSFVLSATKSATVTTASGFELDVDPSKLTLASNEHVTVTIKECLNTDALLAANAATVSNGNMLVSGGSYFIEATQQGKKVEIKNGEKLAIRAPKNHNDDMELFYGNRDKQGNMNWNVATTKITKTQLAKMKKVTTPMQLSKKIVKGDTIIERPCDLGTCLKIHYDSTMKARWDYTRAHKSTMTYAQEIRYGLQPVKFPFDRFKKGIKTMDKSVVQKTRKYGTFEIDTGYSNAVSFMYVTKDTTPLYKDSIYTKMVDNMEEVYETYEESYIGNFGWINIDKFLKEPMCDSTTISLNVKLEDFKIYYKFLDINSVLNETVADNDHSVLLAKTKLPIGKKVEVYIVGTRGNTVYTSKSVFTAGRKNNVDMKLAPLSQGKQV